MRRDPISSETERPRFYSQFWIDVAGGKRDLTAGAVGELEADAETVPEFDEDEDEDFAVVAPEPPPPARPVAKKPVKEKKPEPVRPTITSLADLANIDLLMKNSAAMEGDEVPDLETGTIGDLEPFDTGEPAIVTDFDVDTAAEPEPVTAESVSGEDEAFDDLDYEEEEEEDEWNGPRKPSKQQKKQQQQNRRERRPGF